MSRKTGLLGGTFDPVHNGHIQLAEAAGELCSLDEVLLVPAVVPPHKQEKKIASYADRVAMLELAVSRCHGVTVSTVEQQLSVPSFTIDTIQHLKHTSPNPLDLFFIGGTDTFLDILSWKAYDSILQQCNFIIFSRVGKPSKQLYQFIESLQYQQLTAICWEHLKSGKKIYHLDIGVPDISSSMIRNRLASSQKVSGLLPQEVERYIGKHGLYC